MQLATMRDELTGEIAHYIRLSGGAEIDQAAIAATVERPYTLIPIDEHEAWLIHWRGVKMPLVYGWVVAQEPAFIKAKVTRSMDLMTPLPAWMKTELGWKPPEHAAVMDGTRTSVRLIAGDEASFKRRYNAQLGAKQSDGSYKIKGGAWIKLVANLIRDGILPYQATPVAAEHWNRKASSAIELREYQQPAVQSFLDKGAVLFNFPPGAGKTYIALHILSHFVGRVLILADTVILTEQWRKLLKRYAANPQIIVSTYQGAAKYLDREWDLVIADEAQRLPANTFSRLAFLKTKYRIGMTGTPWREDDRQFMITALSGFPQSIPWSDLISAGVLQKPRIIVAIVKDETAKTALVRRLLEQHPGRALIYCDWIEQGNTLANALGLPFIHGGTANKLQRVEEAERCVVSKIGDRGLDIPDLKLVVEVAFAGTSREQYAQRVGRLLHSQFHGVFYTVFTQAEEAAYRDRITGVEAETAGQIEIEYLYIDGAQQERHSTSTRRAMRRGRRDSARQVAPAQPKSPVEDQLPDEIASLLAIPGINAKLATAEKSVGSRTAPYIKRAFRLCYNAAFNPKEIAEGLGIIDAATVSRFRSACKALLKVGVFKDAGDGRYTVNRDEVNRLQALAGLVRK